MIMFYTKKAIMLFFAVIITISFAFVKYGWGEGLSTGGSVVTSGWEYEIEWTYHGQISILSLPDKELLLGPLYLFEDGPCRVGKAFILGNPDKVYIEWCWEVCNPDYYLISISENKVVQEFPNSIIIDSSPKQEGWLAYSSPKQGGWLAFNQYHTPIFEPNPGEDYDACLAYFRISEEEGEIIPENPSLGAYVYLQQEDQTIPLFSTKASSTLVEADKDPGFFAPDKLIDGTRDTCWSEGAEGDGVGEWVELIATVPVRIKGILVWGGYAHSLTTLEGNGSPAEMEVEIDGKDVGVVKFPPPGGVFTEYVGEWRYDGDDAGITANKIKLTITKVKPGSTWEDCCISEVEVE